MCDALEDGGARCSAHTKPRYDALIEAMENSKSPGMWKADKRNGARRNFEMDGENALNVAINYGTTAKGKSQIGKDIERFAAEGDMKTAGFLRSALKRGEGRAEAVKEVKAVIRKEKARVKALTEGHRGGGAGTSVEELRPSVGTTSENNCLAVYPDIERYWKAEDNNGITPDQVRPGANGHLVWRCHECGQTVDRPTFRVNNLTSGLDKGRVPTCEDCDPRRKARFHAVQNNLDNLVNAIEDPEAFAQLPPAIRYAVLAKLGHTSGPGMERDLSMSIVHGDLSLADIKAAASLNDLDGRILNTGDEDEDNLATFRDVDVTDAQMGEAKAAQTQVEQVMASAGVLGVIGEDEELAAHIRRENNESLWKMAYDNPNDLDDLEALVRQQGTRSEFATQVADQFTEELRRVRAMADPAGYQSQRVQADGSIKEMEPALAQKRFALMVEDRKRVMNWSGTGAGKTLATTLAVQNAGARETLVVCPLAVATQWQDEFEGGFGDRVEVRYGMPDGTEPPIPNGVNRVWIANYDKFRDGEYVAAQTNRLAKRVDAVVFDEIHMAKETDSASRSQRRDVLEKFTDAAGRNNEDLVVIGASATPVVNNLEEARSLLRLVEGPGSKKFNTEPTMKNAAKAYQRLAAAGIRQMPTYPTKMTRQDITVDVSDNINEVLGRINENSKAGAGRANRVHPASIERALLPEKLPAITEAINKARTEGRGPTVVYTEFTKGMVGPMRKHFAEQGLRVATYTGDESVATRQENLEKFKRGEVDVLIGSKPIATGVDGLQNVSSNMVVASMAWTSAQDDQLVGRLQRPGQNRDVNITYVLTEATVQGAYWSWCKNNRQKRIRFKRDLAAAAVDGVMPEGMMESDKSAAQSSVEALKGLRKAGLAA